MIFTEEIGKILWEVIIFITYILVCGSLVERCVRDAEVASSNLVASILCESASAGIAQPVEHFTRNEGVVSSNLISSLPCKES